MTSIPNTLGIGSPGSGKSVGGARDAVEFPGACVVADPHKKSFAELVFEHIDGNVLFDRFSNLRPSLRFNLLPQSRSKHPDDVQADNYKSAQLFTEVMMRRRGGDIASTPLLEEWLVALLLLYLYQRTRKSMRLVPFGFRPGTREFESLIADCTALDIRAKFKQLEKLTPKALRSEIGSAMRVVNAVFRSPYFLARCDGYFDIPTFVRNRGKLIIEKGDCVDDDAFTTFIGAINLLFIEFAKNRSSPYPSIRMYLDEATNAKTAGKIEERAAGETRKNGLSWYVLTQFLNFPGGHDGYFQNFIRKEIYRTADYDLARKMATIIATEFPESELTRANHIQSLTTSIMTLRPGWRFVTGPGGSNRPQYVPLLESDWPDWPGLREAKFQEKLQCVYSRPEYQKHAELTSENSSKPESRPSTKSSGSFSAVEKLRLLVKERTDASAKRETGSESGSEGSSD